MRLLRGPRAAKRYKAEGAAGKHPGQSGKFHAVRAIAAGGGSTNDSAPGEARKNVAGRFGWRTGPAPLLACLQPFAAHGVNLLKIESRPIHGKPFEYQFYVDVDAVQIAQLEAALREVRKATSELRVLGLYAAAKR